MLRWLTRLGWQRGIRGGNRAYLYLGAAALVVRLVARLIKREEKAVYTEKLKPGETLLITHHPRQ